MGQTHYHTNRMRYGSGRYGSGFYRLDSPRERFLAKAGGGEGHRLPQMQYDQCRVI